MVMSRLQTFWRAVFWFGVIVLCGVSLVPQQDLPQTGVLDKWTHVAAYFVVMAASYPAYLSARPLSEIAISIGLVVLGAALEIVQGFLPDRIMSLTDALANAGGVLLAIIAFQIGARLLRRFRGADS